MELKQRQAEFEQCATQAQQEQKVRWRDDTISMPPPALVSPSNNFHSNPTIIATRSKESELHEILALRRKVLELENDRKKLIALLHEAKERLKEGHARTPSPAAAPSLPSSTSMPFLDSRPSSIDAIKVGDSVELAPLLAEIEHLKAELVASREVKFISSGGNTQDGFNLSTDNKNLTEELLKAQATARKAKEKQKAQKKEAEKLIKDLQVQSEEAERKMVEGMEKEVSQF